MKFKGFIKGLALFACIFAIAGNAMSERVRKQNTPRLRIITNVLDKAGYPLSEYQIKQLKAIEPGPEARDEISAILTEDQKDTLKDMRQKQGRANRRPIFMARILDRVGVPLSESQIGQLKAIEPGPEARDEISAILTEDQKEVLKNATKFHRGHGFHRKPVGRILEEADCPLSEEQIQQIRDLKPGSSRKDEMESILTPEQKSILENHFSPNIPEQMDKTTKAEDPPESLNVLKQIYPNPFNPTTTIEYNLAKSGDVRVDIYGSNGQLASTLVYGYQNAGPHSVIWDASSFSAGVYICKITSGNFSDSQKITLVK